MNHRGIVIGLLAVLVLGAPVSALEDVLIVDELDGFQPRRVEVDLGERVRWTNQDSVRHTVTGRGPLRLWDRSILAGKEYSRPFTQGGTFPYLCRIHPSMTGRIRVELGHDGDVVEVGVETLVLRLATPAAPSGFRYRIQRRRAGGTWSAWRIVTTRATRWTPKARHIGDWEFRALTERISNGARSGWSPVREFSIVAG